MQPVSAPQGQTSSYGVSVLKMQHDQAKQLGTAASKLIDNAGQAGRQAAGGSAPGVGGRLDVRA